MGATGNFTHVWLYMAAPIVGARDSNAAALAAQGTTVVITAGIPARRAVLSLFPKC